jgi:hypothetical protein
MCASDTIAQGAVVGIDRDGERVRTRLCRLNREAPIAGANVDNHAAMGGCERSDLTDVEVD